MIKCMRCKTKWVETIKHFNKLVKAFFFLLNFSINVSISEALHSKKGLWHNRVLTYKMLWIQVQGLRPKVLDFVGDHQSLWGPAKNKIIASIYIRIGLNKICFRPVTLYCQLLLCTTVHNIVNCFVPSHHSSCSVSPKPSQCLKFLLLNTYQFLHLLIIVYIKAEAGRQSHCPDGIF